MLDHKMLKSINLWDSLFSFYISENINKFLGMYNKSRMLCRMLLFQNIKFWLIFYYIVFFFSICHFSTFCMTFKFAVYTIHTQFILLIFLSISFCWWCLLYKYTAVTWVLFGFYFYVFCVLINFYCRVLCLFCVFVCVCVFAIK